MLQLGLPAMLWKWELKLIQASHAHCLAGARQEMSWNDPYNLYTIQLVVSFFGDPCVYSQIPYLSHQQVVQSVLEIVGLPVRAGHWIAANGFGMH